MSKTQVSLPPIPEVGQPESYYARWIHLADKEGDTHSREAYKVAQYVTLGMDKHLKWPQKLRYFQHALRRHCNPPVLPEDHVWLFYCQLTQLVREHCGAEALRLASAEDDRYAARAAAGAPRESLETQAELFFTELMGGGERCPEHFGEEDWHQLLVIRNQWL